MPARGRPGLSSFSAAMRVWRRVCGVAADRNRKGKAHTCRATQYRRLSRQSRIYQSSSEGESGLTLRFATAFKLRLPAGKVSKKARRTAGEEQPLHERAWKKHQGGRAERSTRLLVRSSEVRLSPNPALRSIRHRTGKTSIESALLQSPSPQFIHSHSQNND